MRHHLKHMAIGAAAVLAILFVLWVDLGTALRYAALLACPVGMVVMMLAMGRRGGGHHHGATPRRPADDTGDGYGDAPPPSAPRATVPTQRPSRHHARTDLVP